MQKKYTASKFAQIISTAFIAVFIFLFIFASPVKAQNYTDTTTSDPGYDPYLQIKSIDSTFNFSKSGVKVQENISVNFKAESHGIFKYLPEIYEYHSDDGKINQESRLIIKVNSITDENGNSWKYTTYSEKSFVFNKYNILSGAFFNVFVIKIGDENVFVDGAHTYKLNYEISNFPTSPTPLQYGLIGTGVSSEVNNYSATLNFEQAPTNVYCKYGEAGTSTPQVCDFEKVSATQYKISKTLVNYKYDIQLNAEGLTFNHDTSDTILFLIQYWYLIIPPIAIILLLIYGFSQRGPKGTGVIVPQFGIPDNLKPAEIGTIYDDSVDKIDVSATIIDLAVNGVIKIRNQDEKGKDFDLVLLKNINEAGLNPYEYLLVNEIFKAQGVAVTDNNLPTVSLKDLKKESMYSTYKSIQNKIYLDQVKNGFYKHKPDKANSMIYAICFAAAIFAPAIIFNFLSFPVAIVIGIIALIPAIAVFYLRNYKTEKGVLMLEKIQGLKLFIEYAKKDQLEMLQTPMSKQEIFEKYLPYAMVFNLHKSWAEAFKDLNIENPSWYEGGYRNNMFDIIYFTGYMNMFSNTINTSFNVPVSQSGSGFMGGIGGGSIGGGFSGGGMGRW